MIENMQSTTPEIGMVTAHWLVAWQRHFPSFLNSEATDFLGAELNDKITSSDTYNESMT